MKLNLISILQRRTLVIISTLILSSNLIASDGPLEPIQLDLIAKSYKPFSLKLNGSLSLEKEKDHWRYSLSSKSRVIKITETSEFYLNENKVQPISYISSTKIPFSKTVNHIKYRTDSQKIETRFNDKNYSFDYDNEHLDALSFQVDLMIKLNLNQPVPEYKIQKLDRQGSYIIELIGEEVLTTSFGKIKTIQLRQTDPSKPNRYMSIWLAKEFNFIPIRIENYRSNKIHSSIEIVGGYVGNRSIH